MADTAALPTAFINGEKGKQDSPDPSIRLVSMDSRVHIHGEREISDLRATSRRIHSDKEETGSKKKERKLQISVRMAEPMAPALRYKRLGFFVA